MFDPTFKDSFLYTFRTFMTPEELLDAIMLRYFLQPAAGEDLQAFETNKRKPLRLKVLAVLKTWIKDHFVDFENQQLTDKFHKFLARVSPRSAL